MRRHIAPITALVTLAGVSMAGCSIGVQTADPSTTLATETTTAETDPATTAAAATTAAPVTTAATTAPPATTAAPTTTAAAATTAAPAPTQAAAPTTVAAQPAPAGNVELIQVPAIGVDITDNNINALIDNAGFRDVPPATAYQNFGAAASGAPLVVVDKAGMTEMGYSQYDKTGSAEYRYHIQAGDGATPETLIAPVQAAVQAKYPAYALNNESGSEDNFKFARVELKDAEKSYQNVRWNIAIFQSKENPHVAVVAVIVDAPIPEGPKTVAPVAKPGFDQMSPTVGAPVGAITETRVSQGLNMFDGNPMTRATVQFESGNDFNVTWPAVRDALKGQGYEESDVGDKTGDSLSGYMNHDDGRSVNVRQYEDDPVEVEIQYEL